VEALLRVVEQRPDGPELADIVGGHRARVLAGGPRVDVLGEHGDVRMLKDPRKVERRGRHGDRRVDLVGHLGCDPGEAHRAFPARLGVGLEVEDEEGQARACGRGHGFSPVKAGPDYTNFGARGGARAKAHRFESWK